MRAVRPGYACKIDVVNLERTEDDGVELSDVPAAAKTLGGIAMSGLGCVVPEALHPSTMARKAKHFRGTLMEDSSGRRPELNATILQPTAH